MSYNHAASKGQVGELVKNWRSNPIYFNAVKNMIYRIMDDFFWGNYFFMAYQLVLIMQ
ncbi:MAG TPA: hypothetical protein VFF23_01490 [Hanamia sp.]|nr:hypothetical protein [Hanamia sp.]